MFLNKRQLEVLIDDIKKDVQIPLLADRMEDKIVRKMVENIAPKLEPSLRKLFSQEYVDCLKIALDEELSVKERRRSIASMMREKIAGPLAIELSEESDEPDSTMRHIPSKVKEPFFKVAANKFVDELIEWTVGAVDKKFEETES